MAKKVTREVSSGRAYVHATYNNTFITFTDEKGNVFSWSSGGRIGFKGPKKSTAYAASLIVKDVLERARPYGLKEVRVYVSGVGAGREATVRALNAEGVNILSIKDVTPLPHNGCRPRGPRRV